MPPPRMIFKINLKRISASSHFSGEMTESLKIRRGKKNGEIEKPYRRFQTKILPSRLCSN